MRAINNNNWQSYSMILNILYIFQDLFISFDVLKQSIRIHTAAHFEAMLFEAIKGLFGVQLGSCVDTGGTCDGKFAAQKTATKKTYRHKNTTTNKSTGTKTSPQKKKTLQKHERQRPRVWMVFVGFSRSKPWTCQFERLAFE